MKLNEQIEQLQKLNDVIENASFKKTIRKVISLLEEIENKHIPNEEKEKIQTSISPYLNNIQSQKDLKMSLKKLRKSLTKDFGFAPPNYYLTLGIGLGLALGTSQGILLGVPFDKGIVGSGIGLIGGLIVGMFMDKEKESENRILKNL